MVTVSLPISAPAQEAASSSAPGCPSGSAGVARAQVGGDPQPPARHAPATARPRRSRPAPGRAAGRSAPASARRSAISSRYQASSSRWSARVRLRPVQLRAQEGRLVLRVRARRRRPSRARRTPPGGRRATASASPGSVWSVKYCHGVAAPHSSPMNSIGVNGRGQHQPRADLEQAGRQARGDPVAGGPVADLVVVLQVAEEAVGGGAQHVHRPAVAAAAERRPAAVVEEHPGQRLGERRDRAEVAVVALPLAGERRVHGVVEVVAPLRGQPVPARLPGGDQPGVVAGRIRRSAPAPGPAARRAPAPRPASCSSKCSARWSSSACTASSRSPSRW